MKKPLTCLCLISILSFGLVLLSPNFFVVNATTDANKPSVPEFSVNFVAYPYDVPEKTITTVDQYTGKETVKTTPGYRVENKSIEIVVKNQPFTPYTDEDGHEINLFYDVQVKGHYGDEWKTFGSSYSYGAGREPNAQLDSECTFISIETEEYPGDAVLDFRVQTLVGYYFPYGRGAIIWGWDFEGQESGWSQIQTFSLAETKFEVIPEFPSWVIFPLFVLIATVVLVCRNRLNKAKKTGVCTLTN